MKPIFIAGPVCLHCHGAPDKLAPGVAEALKELYPMDRRRGTRWATSAARSG